MLTNSFVFAQVKADRSIACARLQVGPPAPPEDPSKWHAVVIEEEQVCKEYNATPDALVAWRKFGFPVPRTKQIVSRFSWTNKVARSYVAERSRKMDAQILDLAAHVSKRTR